MDRLFVPLNSDPWNWFRRGDKTVEVRGISARFNFKTVYSGRAVELRKGYSGPSIWGKIGEKVEGAPSASKLFQKIDPGEVVPGATESEAIELVETLLENYQNYIAFRIKDPNLRPSEECPNCWMDGYLVCDLGRDEVCSCLCHKEGPS